METPYLEYLGLLFPFKLIAGVRITTVLRLFPYDDARDEQQGDDDDNGYDERFESDLHIVNIARG